MVFAEGCLCGRQSHFERQPGEFRCRFALRPSGHWREALPSIASVSCWTARDAQRVIKQHRKSLRADNGWR